VLLNLLGNAVKFTEKGAATIELFCENPPLEGRAALSLVIRDTGIGIPAEARERIFGGSSRPIPRRRAASRTGLGLAISKRLSKR